MEGMEGLFLRSEIRLELRAGRRLATAACAGALGALAAHACVGGNFVLLGGFVAVYTIISMML